MLGGGLGSDRSLPPLLLPRSLLLEDDMLRLLKEPLSVKLCLEGLDGVEFRRDRSELSDLSLLRLEIGRIDRWLIRFQRLFFLGDDVMVAGVVGVNDLCRPSDNGLIASSSVPWEFSIGLASSGAEYVRLIFAGSLRTSTVSSGDSSSSFLSSLSNSKCRLWDNGSSPFSSSIEGILMTLSSFDCCDSDSSSWLEWRR